MIAFVRVRCPNRSRALVRKTKRANERIPKKAKCFIVQEFRCAPSSDSLTELFLRSLVLRLCHIDAILE
jgi:hypothetical protein